jgi:hypothetical protein
MKILGTGQLLSELDCRHNFEIGHFHSRSLSWNERAAEPLFRCRRNICSKRRPRREWFWNCRKNLHLRAVAFDGAYKHATMLPEETIRVEGKKYACYVGHVSSDDTRTVQHTDRTFWIDKSAHVFPKQIEHSDNYIMITKTVGVPFHQDTTTVYPVADFHPQTPVETFRFVPPANAKQVASLEPEWTPPAPLASPQMTGQKAPEIAFTGADGGELGDGGTRGNSGTDGGNSGTDGKFT